MDVPVEVVGVVVGQGVEMVELVLLEVVVLSAVVTSGAGSAVIASWEANTLSIVRSVTHT